MSKNTERVRALVKKAVGQILSSEKQSMVSINAHLEVNASVDRIWDIVSDVDKDSVYWSSLHSVRNIRKEGNLIERDVKVGFMGNEGHQVIKLNPIDSIEMTMRKGP